MKVRVQMEFEYEVPDTPEEREAIYGTADLTECVQIDLENDAAATILEADELGWHVVIPEWAPNG